MPEFARQDTDAAHSSIKLEVVAPMSNQLQPEEQEKAMQLIHRDTYYSQTMLTLTTGIFMIGMAIQLKASNVVIGMLAAIPALAQLLQLPAIQLLRGNRSRRQICVWTALISRLCIAPMAIAAWIPDSRLALLLLSVAFIGHSSIGAIGACAWNAWLKDVIPTGRLGSFFACKLCLATIITIATTFLGGACIDFCAHAMTMPKLHAYSVLFGVALLAGMAGIPQLKRIPEAPPAQSQEPQNALPLAAMVKEPFCHENFKRLILFMGSWNFAINLAIPFFTVYMLTMLGYSMALVTGLTLVSQISNLLFFRLWGKLADRFSNKSVLSVSARLFLGCVLGWTFIPHHAGTQSTLLFTAILHVLLGISYAGVMLASGNIALKLVPQQKSVSFLAVNNFTSSIAAGIAPIFGGLFADYFSHAELALVLQWQNTHSFFNVKTLDFQYWDFFFVLAFLLGLMSLRRLADIREPGDVQKRIIVRAFLQESRRSLPQWRMPKRPVETQLKNRSHPY